LVRLSQIEGGLIFFLTLPWRVEASEVRSWVDATESVQKNPRDDRKASCYPAATRAARANVDNGD